MSRNCCVIGNKSSEYCTSLLPLNCGIKRMWWVWFCFLPLPKCKKATPRVLLRVHVAAYLLCPKITHLIYFWLCKFSSHYLCPLLNNILITLLFQLPAQILLLFLPLHCLFLIINIWMLLLIYNKNFNLLSYFTSDIPRAHLYLAPHAFLEIFLKGLLQQLILFAASISVQQLMQLF